MSLLHIIPYPIVPPRGGGALRCYHILRQLARFYDVHAIVFQREDALRNGVDGYKVPDNVHIYSPLDHPPPHTVFDRLPKRLGPGLHYRWLRRSWRGPATAELLRSHHLIKKIVSDYTIDIAVFEHISSMSVAPWLNRLNPRTLRILDAHNVDHRLMAQEIENKKKRGLTNAEQRLLASTTWIEHHLGQYVDAFFACSDDDRLTLERCSGINGHTIPNGVDTQRVAWREPATGKATDLLFCGSLGYRPNIDGLNWFGMEIWPLLKQAAPDVRLTVIGRGGNKADFRNLPEDPQVNWIGEVDATLPYYHKAAVHICPLRMGSGTRLKILESMSAGTPMVSTKIGAEGIQAVSGRHLLLADDPTDFAQAVVGLLENAELRMAISREARKLVEERYDWDVVGERMKRTIEKIAHGTHGTHGK